jgi:exopolysaccharide production protein ExoQ
MNNSEINSADRRAPGNAEKALVVLILLLSLGAFQNLLVTGHIDTQNMGMLGMQILWSFLYVIVFAIYIKVCRQPIQKIVTIFPILAVIALAFSSLIWSQDWELTMRRSVALAFTLVFGVYFASRFNTQQQFRLLVTTFAVCIVFSFFFELLNLNPSEDIAGWYGVFYLKTQLGANMALASIIYVFWKSLEPAKSKLANVGLVASLLLVVLSCDVTSLITVVALLGSLPFVRWALRRSALGAFTVISSAFAFGSLAILYIGSHLQQATGLVGKDPMLTGRVPLWILATAMAVRRPWFGYGFDAFWLPGTIYVRRMWQILRWMPPHAHNGLLELWLELGLVGVGLFLVGFGYYLLRAVRHLRSDHRSVAAWPLIFLLFLFVSNLTESHFLNSNSVYFILYVAVAATLVDNGRTTLASSLPVEPHYV